MWRSNQSSIVTSHAVSGRMNRPAAHAGSRRLAMTVHAPAHAEGLDLPDALHCLNGSMTALAFEPRGDVRTMVEVDEVGKVATCPGNQPWRTSFDRLQQVVEANASLLELRRNDGPLRSCACTASSSSRLRATP